MPELPEGWASRNDLEPFREDASQLIQRMGASANGSGVWGWKDPRNSITIQFWKSLLPDLRVVVCVRNPLEVAASLQKRNNLSYAASGRLWLQYYRNILENVPRESRIITLFENYFSNPDAELKRLLGALSLPANGQVAPAVRESVKPALRHNQSSLEQLLAAEWNPEIVEIYARLRDEAGVNGHVLNGGVKPAANGLAVPVGTACNDLQRSRFHVETVQREEYIRRLGTENTALRQSLDDLKAQLDTLKKEVAPGGRHPYAQNLSAMVERAIAAHGLIAHKRAQLASLQGQVEATLKETKPMWPRLIRCSNSINSLYRMFKRARKAGKLFKLQRELNDVTAESLGTLTHIAAVMVGHRAEAFVSPPGLERYAIEKIRMDVPRLMEMLQIRLS
jgi:hypothetical protein